jgi:hypothetical protein
MATANPMAPGTAGICGSLTGADERNRTADLLITNQLLYHLSYISMRRVGSQYILKSRVCAVASQVVTAGFTEPRGSDRIAAKHT